MSDAIAGVVVLIVVAIAGIIGFCLYFLPSIVAHRMKRRNRVPITLLNIFLGWTFFGWVGTMVWACLEDGPPQPPAPQPAYPPMPPQAYQPPASALPPPPPPVPPAPAPAQNVSSGRYCTGCGAYSAGGARFCNSCGQAFA